MKHNYYNPTIREYGDVYEHDSNGWMNGKIHTYCANYRNSRGAHSHNVCKTFEDADAIMRENGYERMGVIDESGCRRYTMTLPELQGLYKRFENFVADCTEQEYRENKAAITAVYALIHKHIQSEVFK